MDKKWVISLFFFLMFIPAVFAVPPSDIFNIYADKGLQLEVPVYKYYGVTDGAELYVHVFNKSDGTLLTKHQGVNCSVEIYSTNGSIIYNIYPENTDHDFRFSYPPNSFEDNGVYSFNIICNTTEEGGFYTGFFELTDSGEEKLSLQVLPIVLFFGIICLLLLFGALYLFISGKKGSDE